MSKYGCGISFVRACEMDKEQIKHALQGELVVNETENGFVYGKADKQACDQFIIDAYDNVVYHAIEAMRSGKAYDRFLSEKGLTISLPEYLKSRAIVLNEERETYKYDCDLYDEETTI